MTKEQLNKLTPNQRIRMWNLDVATFKGTYLYGYVMKIYNGNWQVKVWFDGEPKARIVGYTQIENVV